MGTKKVGVGPQIRIINFIVDLLGSTRPIEYSRFSDEEEWGNERTFRRMRALINDAWEIKARQPLFSIVDEDGVPAERGDGRFIKLVDKSIQTSRAERMAVMPAFMQMLQTLKGTIFADEFKPLYAGWYAELPRPARKHFDRTEKKFYCFNKGSKRYDTEGRAEVLEEVYDALLKEQYLSVTRQRGDDIQNDTLMPLSLVMFNTGLYLLCRYRDSDSPKVYTIAIEHFTSAKSLRGKGFIFPNDFAPENHFDGSFGFIRGDDACHYTVTLEYSKKSWVRTYLRDRRWTGSEEYSEPAPEMERFSMDVSDLREVLPWVLPFASDAKIISPPELIQEVRGRARKIAELNREG